MTPEEIAAKEIADKIKSQSEQVETLRKEVDSLKAAGEKTETLEKALKTAEEALKTLQKFQEDAIKDLESLRADLDKANKNVKPEGFKTIGEALFEAFKAQKETIDNIVKSGGKQDAPLVVTIETKAAVDITTENTIGAGTTQHSLAQNTGIISTIRKREMTYLANVSVGSIGTQTAWWIDEVDEQGDPIFIGEGDAKTKLSVRYEESTKTVKKIAAYTKVTTEMMADLPQLISYIQNNLLRRLDLKVEDQLFNGNGSGDNLSGLETFATAFAAPTSLAASVADANELDAIEAIALQVKEAFGTPTGLFIHPGTMSKIKLIKDSAGRPVWKDYVTIDGSMNVSGLRLIETTAVTAGDFLGGDLSVVNVLYRDQLGIQIGLDGNDFTNNKKTMLAEKRLVQFVTANDTPVIVKGDFATAIAAIVLP